VAHSLLFDRVPPECGVLCSPNVGIAGQDECRAGILMRSFLLGLLLGALGPILFDGLRYRLKGEPAEDRSRAAAGTGAGRSTEQPRHGEGATSVDLSQLTAAELYRRAQTAGIAGRSGMSKAQLIAALQAASGL
jgi:hypothetical protein